METEAHPKAWLWTYGYDYLATCWLNDPGRMDPQVLEQWCVPMGRENRLLSDALYQVVRMLEDPSVQTGAKDLFRSGIVLPIPVTTFRPMPRSFGIRLLNCGARRAGGPVVWCHRGRVDGMERGLSPGAAPDNRGLEWVFAAEPIARSSEVSENRGDLAQQFAEHLNQWVTQQIGPCDGFNATC